MSEAFDHTVLAVFHDAGLAGAELVLLDHLRALKARGARIVAVVPRKGALVQALAEVAAEVVVHAAPWWIRIRGSRTHAKAWTPTARGGLRLRIEKSVTALQKIMQKQRAEVVVSAASVLLSPAIAARTLGIAAVQFVHERPSSGGFYEKGHWDAPLPWQQAAELLRTANHRLLWSSPACAAAWSGSGVFAETDRFLPHPIDLSQYPPPANGRTQPDQKLHLTFVGTWDPRKGLDHFFFLCFVMQASHHRFRATIVGHQPPTRYMRKWRWEFQRAQFADKVKIIPFADNLPELFAHTDVLMHPAKEDTSPLILAHAMAAGVRIVASDLPGIREMLTGYRPEQEPAGLLLPSGDMTAWTDALHRVVGLELPHDPLRVIKVARETFSSDVILERFTRFLQEAMEQAAAEGTTAVVGQTSTASRIQSLLKALDGAGRKQDVLSTLWAASDQATDWTRGVIAQLP